MLLVCYVGISFFGRSGLSFAMEELAEEEVTNWHKDNNLINYIAGKTTVEFSLQLREANYEGSTVILYRKEKAREKSIYHTSKADISERLVAASIIRFSANGHFYFLSKWSRGGHGEELSVIDLDTDKKLEVYKQTSSMPMTFKIENQKLYIYGSGDMGPGNIPKKEHRIWSPK